MSYKPLECILWAIIQPCYACQMEVGDGIILWGKWIIGKENKTKWQLI